MPPRPSRLLYVDHLGRQGKALFGKVCALYLEGVVAKPADDTDAPTRWCKFKNPRYSQAEGRGELFHKKRRQPARWANACRASGTR